MASSLSPPPTAAKRKRRDVPREDEQSRDYRTRDCNRLFAQDVTVKCARHCVPCAYKCGCFDVALDRDFTRMVPNQRPEQCPRAKSTTHPTREGTLGYRCGMAVLTVGDGDLSFSLAVARILGPNGGRRLIATSYETRATLERVYPNFLETLTELEALGAHVAFRVDAEKLHDTMPTSQDLPSRFHRIVWNFPCTAVDLGQDGQNDAMEANKELVRRFVSDARHMLCHGGEVHMMHKTKPPYNQWDLEKVALESCQGDPRMQFSGRVILDRYTLPPYTPRKARDRKSFPCHDACTFVFAKEESASASWDEVSFPSTVPADKDASKESLISVTPDLIHNIRDAHIRRAVKRVKDRISRRSKKRRRR